MAACDSCLPTRHFSSHNCKKPKITQHPLSPDWELQNWLSYVWTLSIAYSPTPPLPPSSFHSALKARNIYLKKTLPSPKKRETICYSECNSSEGSIKSFGGNAGPTATQIITMGHSDCKMLPDPPGAWTFFMALLHSNFLARLRGNGMGFHYDDGWVGCWQSRAFGKALYTHTHTHTHTLT